MCINKRFAKVLMPSSIEHTKVQHTTKGWISFAPAVVGWLLRRLSNLMFPIVVALVYGLKHRGLNMKLFKGYKTKRQLRKEIEVLKKKLDFATGIQETTARERDRWMSQTF